MRVKRRSPHTTATDHQRMPKALPRSEAAEWLLREARAIENALPERVRLTLTREWETP